METLILIQTIISNIEDISLECKYHSSFDYRDEKTLIIETYCREWRITLEMLLSKVNDTATYVIDNNKLEIRDYSWLNKLNKESEV